MLPPTIRKAPSYSGRPIASIDALARALGVPFTRLASTLPRVNRLYGHAVVVRKKSKERLTYPALPELRDLHQRIADRILRRIALPDYLLGGVPGRSYIGNARLHAGSQWLLGEDAEDFYPSISLAKVAGIFAEVCCFTPEVSRALARLCCRRGELVQGGVASTLLANLALHRTEPDFATYAEAEQLTYTRFVDDTHLSSKRPHSGRFVTDAVQRLRAMLERAGFRPKRSKQFLARAGTPMQVHRLNVNSTASMPAARRQSLRNELFLLEQWAARLPWDGAMERVYIRLCSRTGQLKQLNYGDWHRLRLRLEALGPRRSAMTVYGVTTARHRD